MERCSSRSHTVASRTSPCCSYTTASMSIDISVHKPKVLPEAPVKCGWGFQCHCLKSDTKLFFILYPHSLEFFTDSSRTNLVGKLNFNLYSFTIEQMSKNELRFSAYSLKKSLRFKFSEEVIVGWVLSINYCIARAKGGLFRISRDEHRAKFWKDTGISEEEFLSQADNGDLLLFISRNSGSTLQRCLTRTKYDHVGLILKFENQEIGFIEATRPYGVVFTYWDEFFQREFKKHYKSVSYRKLEVVRTKKMLEDLEEFTRNAKGKNYRLGITRNRAKTLTPGDEDTFFCSELAASAYKIMGILDNLTPSYKYFPSHFTDSHNLHPLQGFLHKEQCIDMNYTLTSN